MAHCASVRLAAVALLLASCPLAMPAAEAAEVELGLVAGGQQTGGLQTRDGHVDLEAGPLYGLTIGWRVRPDGILELAWSRQDSEATGELRNGPLRRDVTFDTVELGGLWETRPGPMRPFLGLHVGGTRLAGLAPGADEGWDASGSISGGARWFLGDHAILRLEARATGILLSEGHAVACSSLPADCTVAAEGSLLGAFSARASLAARF